MKVGIIGTRGIPNAYGGFEQFAEYLSLYLVGKGHEVKVYNSHLHPYKQDEWKGVGIIHCKDWEDRIGTPGQFIYDFNCIMDSRKRDYDVLLILGYTSSSIWSWLLPKQAVILCNVDGMEWKRSKFSGPVQHFLRWAERWAVKSSDKIIADSEAIKAYIDKKYAIESLYIPYGAPVAPKRDINILAKYDLKASAYNMLVARMEPENNIEMILDGHMSSKKSIPFIVVGDAKNAYSNFLRERYQEEESIRFMGPIFEVEVLDCLRQHCATYFHGHSVGGTNPSLLEAMGCSALIAAHDNAFNRAVLATEGLYFNTSDEVAYIIDNEVDELNSTRITGDNIKKIEQVFNWGHINAQYEQAMLDLINERQGHE